MTPPEPPGMLDVLMLDRPEQLKALGHPLRLRILETLGTNATIRSRIASSPAASAWTPDTCTSTCACSCEPA